MAKVDDVRLLAAQVPTSVFDNTDLQTFLDLEEGDVKLAAALALDALASNEAHVLKVIDTRDLSTDGASLAEALREQAKVYRQQAGGGVELVELADTLENLT